MNPSSESYFVQQQHMLPLTLPPSPNITIVNCTDPNFLNLYSYTSGHWCFANAGYTPAIIPNVTYVCGGNNNAYIYTQSYGTFYIGAGQCRSLVPIITYGITVTGIDIL